MVVLDTDIIIDHLRTFSKHESFLLKLTRKISQDEIGLSVISIEELYQGQSTKDLHKESVLIAVISTLKILSYNFRIAKLAGEIIRDSKRLISFADAAIAATAIANQGELLTLNKKDFRGIKKLQLY